MGREWLKVVERLKVDYPLQSADEKERGAYPSVASPIDIGAATLLKDYAEPNPIGDFNPLQVEQLIESVGSRVASCMTYREKAQELEVRLANEAINYSSQKILLESAKALDTLAAQIEPSFLRNAGSVTTTDGTTIGDGSDADYWRRQSELRVQQSDALLRALEETKTKAGDDGNGSNAAQRFAFLKALLDQNLIEAYKRARAAAVGLKAVYGIEAPLPDLRDVGYLNELVLWTQRASDKLDAQLDRRYQGTLALSLASPSETVGTYQLLPSKRYAEMCSKGRFEFDLSAAPFEAAGMRNPKLRGIQVRLHVPWNEKRAELIGWLRDFLVWPCSVDLPEQKLQGASSVHPRFSAPAHLADRDEAQIPVGRTLHNVDPVGAWAVTLAATDISGTYSLQKHSAAIISVFLTLRLSYERAKV